MCESEVTRKHKKTWLMWLQDIKLQHKTKDPPMVCY